MIKTIFITTFFSLIIGHVAFSQPGIICKWDNNKQAGVVLTFDDWLPGRYLIER